MLVTDFYVEKILSIQYAAYWFSHQKLKTVTIKSHRQNFVTKIMFKYDFYRFDWLRLSE